MKGANGVLWTIKTGSIKKCLALSILLSFFFIGGCAGTIVKTEGIRIERESLTDIKPSVTTRDSVISLFGNPSETSSGNGEETLKYIFKEQKTPTYMGGFVEDSAGAKTTTTTLEFTIKDNIVQSYRFKSSEE